MASGCTLSAPVDLVGGPLDSGVLRFCSPQRFRGDVFSAQPFLVVADVEKLVDVARELCLFLRVGARLPSPQESVYVGCVGLSE